MTKPLSIETDAVLNDDMHIHIKAEQCHAGGYLNRPIEIQDGFDLTIDMSEYDTGIYGTTKIIFSDGKTLEVGKGWTHFKNEDDKGFYTEWSF